MSDDAYEPMDPIDWDLIDKDHTIAVSYTHLTLPTICSV